MTCLRLNYRWLIFAAIALLLYPSASATESSDRFYPERQIAASLTANHVPAMALAVAIHGKIVWDR